MRNRPIHSSAQVLHERMDYQECPPPLDLANSVLDFWQIRTKSPDAIVPSQLFPTDLIRIRFMIFPDRILPLLYGPSSSPHRKGLYVGEQVSFGASILPTAATQLLGIPIEEIRDSRIDLEAIWPNDVPTLSAEIWEGDFDQRMLALGAFLRTKLAIGKQPNASFSAAYLKLQHSAGTEQISQISGSLGISHRSLDRYFARHVGLTPKETARVLRFQHNLRHLLNDQTTEQIDGYSDQSHWIRDFRALVGMPPGEYVDQISSLHRLENPYWTGTSPAHYRDTPKTTIRFPDWKCRSASL